MPIYQYESIVDGGIIEEVKPVARRDECPVGHRRISVPKSLTVVGAGSRVPAGTPLSTLPQKEQVRQGYHKMEERLGSRFKSKHSKKTISKAWGF